MLKKGVTVGTVNKWHIQHGSVFKGLLHATANDMVVVFGKYRCGVIMELTIPKSSKALGEEICILLEKHMNFKKKYMKHLTKSEE